MARSYANENFPLPTVELLSGLGHDVLTTQNAGKSGAAIPDDEVLHDAHFQNWVLLTFNRKDFIRLHLSGQAHSGILACRFDPDFLALAQPDLATHITPLTPPIPERSTYLTRHDDPDTLLPCVYAANGFLVK